MPEGEQSLKEKRIRSIAISYYSRIDVRENMLAFAQNREVVPRYFEGFGKRPDTLQFESDIFELAKKGATSFHCSEELWNDPLELSTEMTETQLHELRKGWDFLIDVDSKYLDYSKIATELLVKALEHNGVKNIGVKFSGSKGFHIIVPWKAFPKQIQDQKTNENFPEWPRLICQYLNDQIKENLIERITDMMMKDRKSYVQIKEAAEDVAPDIILVSSRHLFRMPYSLHEKTALSSVVIDKDKISEFDIRMADALNLKELKDFVPDSEEGEAMELLMQALDHKPVETQAEIEKKERQKKGDFKEIIIKDLTPELYPPTIKQILSGVKSDGRKRALFILLNFFRSLKVDQTKIETIIDEWNKKNYEPLKSGYIKAQLSWHAKNPVRLPPNFDKPHYKAIGISPTEQELKAKNPISYVVRKNFALQNMRARTKKKPGKSQKTQKNKNF